MSYGHHVRYRKKKQDFDVPKIDSGVRDRHSEHSIKLWETVSWSFPHAFFEPGKDKEAFRVILEKGVPA